jgi:hypothetical protein
MSTVTEDRSNKSRSALFAEKQICGTQSAHKGLVKLKAVHLYTSKYIYGQCISIQRTLHQYSSIYIFAPSGALNLTPVCGIIEISGLLIQKWPGSTLQKKHICEQKQLNLCMYAKVQTGFMHLCMKPART